MITKEQYAKINLNALSNVAISINLGKYFPDQIFIGAWDQFLFFSSDQMFSPDFMDVLHKLIREEEADSICLLNISNYGNSDLEKSSALYLYGYQSHEEYYQALQLGGVANGWLYGVDRYGCASNKGEWCIYCEKENDIAVIALKYRIGLSKFNKSLSQLNAKFIESLLNETKENSFPFDRLVPSWRTSLLRSYSK